MQNETVSSLGEAIVKIESLQADCAAMRKNFADALMELESYHIDWAKLNSESPDYDKTYKPEFPPFVIHFQELFKKSNSNPGQPLLDKIKRLEEHLLTSEHNSKQLDILVYQLKSELTKAQDELGTQDAELIVLNSELAELRRDKERLD